MHPRTLRARLVLFAVLTLLVAAAVGSALLVRAFEDYTRSRAAAQLTRQSSALAQLYARQAIGSLTQGGPAPHISAPIRRLSDARLFFIGNSGSPLPGKEASIPSLNLPVDWKLINAGGTQVFSAYRPPGGGAPQIIALSGVFITPDNAPAAGQEAIGAIALARPVQRLTPSTLEILRQILPAILIGIAVALALAVWIGGSIARPLGKLRAATGRIAAGEYEVELDTRRPDEIGDVNRSFKAMAEDLARTKEHERLFLMRVSHELRTPLTVIEGYLQALQDGVIDDARGRTEAFELMSAEALRLGRLVSDQLDLAKLEARRFALSVEEVDLAVLLAQSATARREEARSREIELRIDVARAPVVIGDGDRIAQIVGNLVANALRWTPDGGTIRVSAQPLAEGVRIEVADSGPGIPPEKRDDVFRPFFSEHGAGTGLGLPIAAELAQAMGGSLDLGSAPEGGALFGVTLPRDSSHAVALSERLQSA